MPEGLICVYLLETIRRRSGGGFALELSRLLSQFGQQVCEFRKPVTRLAAALAFPGIFDCRTLWQEYYCTEHYCCIHCQQLGLAQTRGPRQVWTKSRTPTDCPSLIPILGALAQRQPLLPTAYYGKDVNAQSSL